MKNKLCGIYKITNKINGKVYIGMTYNSFTSRWYQHLYYLRHNKHDNYKFQEDFNTYGVTAFAFEIVEVLNGDEDLTLLEQKYINQIDFNKDYNLINSNLLQEENSFNEKQFIDFINKKWLVPKGVLHKDELDKYKIYKNEDKNEIIEMVIKCKLLKLYFSQITFSKVIDLMQNNLGYTIESQRGNVNKKRYTYKLIIDFDEDRVNIEQIEKEKL